VNDEIEWAFHGFELEESTWAFQNKTKQNKNLPHRLVSSL
jgi:hypothetical protein